MLLDIKKPLHLLDRTTYFFQSPIMLMATDTTRLLASGSCEKSFPLSLTLGTDRFLSETMEMNYVGMPY